MPAIFAVAPAIETYIWMESDQDSIAGDGGVPPAPVRQRRAPQAILRIYLLVACTNGWWSAFEQGDAYPDSWAAASEAGVIVGLALASAWSLTPVESAPSDSGMEYMRSESSRRVQCHVLGYVQNPVVATAALLEPVPVVAEVVLAGPTLLRLQAALATMSDREGGDVRLTVGSIVQQWKQRGAKVSSAVRMAPRVLQRILSGRWSCLHCALITRRLNRRLLLVFQEPPRKPLSEFVRARPHVIAELPPPTAPPTPRWFEQMVEPALIIEWLGATSYLKDVRQARAAAKAFAPLFSRSSGKSSLELMHHLPSCASELLRRGRVRLDCVSMLLHRRLWVSMVTERLENIAIYLFTDASPQWRGIELFASSYDVSVNGGPAERRLFPLISIDKSRMDTLGKALTLLWQICLIVGPLPKIDSSWGR